MKVILLFCLFLLLTPFADCEPLDEPSIEILYASDLIATVEYLGLQSTEKVDYFNPPVALFKVINIHQGTAEKDTIAIYYDFHDGSSCIAEWKEFKPLEHMPKVGTQFVAFANLSTNKKAYQTYRGPYGLKPLKKVNLDKIKKEISSRKPVIYAKATLKRTEQQTLEGIQEIEFKEIFFSGHQIHFIPKKPISGLKIFASVENRWMETAPPQATMLLSHQKVLNAKPSKKIIIDMKDVVSDFKNLYKNAYSFNINCAIELDGKQTVFETVFCPVR